MKKIMVLSCMLISMSMVNAMEQNAETYKKIKQEIPLEYFMLPHMNPEASRQRYLAFHGYTSAKSSDKSKSTTSPKPERNLP